MVPPSQRKKQQDILPRQNTVQPTLKPPLKWAGGKRWLVPYLREYWTPHSHRRLVEPFCGGLAVTLGLMPDSALLNDINRHLINFFRWVSKGLQVEIDMRNEKGSIIPTVTASMNSYSKVLTTPNKRQSCSIISTVPATTAFAGSTRKVSSTSPSGVTIP